MNTIKKYLFNNLKMYNKDEQVPIKSESVQYLSQPQKEKGLLDFFKNPFWGIVILIVVIFGGSFLIYKKITGGSKGSVPSLGDIMKTLPDAI